MNTSPLNQDCQTPEELLRSKFFLLKIKEIPKKIERFNSDEICRILKGSAGGEITYDAEKEMILTFFQSTIVQEHGEQMLKSIGNKIKWNKSNPLLQKIYGNNGYEEICNCVGKVVGITKLILESGEDDNGLEFINQIDLDLGLELDLIEENELNKIPVEDIDDYADDDGGIEFLYDEDDNEEKK